MLTMRQAEAHRFIFEYIRWNGETPTCQMIAEGLGLRAKSNASRLCTQLEDRGYIRRIKRSYDYIEILKRPALPNTQ